MNRPWVETEAGRNEYLGEVLNCVRCDRLEFPDKLVAYKRTPTFTEQTIPAGLQKNHSTKAGTWAIIQVLDGTLIYTMNCPEPKQVEITKGENGVVVPRMLHHVEPNGPVEFYVEFYSKNVSS